MRETNIEKTEKEKTTRSAEMELFAGTEDEREYINATLEQRVKLAAEHIRNADLLLIATGAGMSADSGLAVYKDIANVPIYNKLGLTYGMLCRPQWQQQDAEIFYGFWGNCYNTYMEVDPHRGYRIINDILKKRFLENSPEKKQLFSEIMEKLYGEQYSSSEPFFIFTSNVWFRESTRATLANRFALRCVCRCDAASAVLIEC